MSACPAQKIGPCSCLEKYEEKAVWEDQGQCSPVPTGKPQSAHVHLGRGDSHRVVCACPDGILCMSASKSPLASRWECICHCERPLKHRSWSLQTEAPSLTHWGHFFGRITAQTVSLLPCLLLWLTSESKHSPRSGMACLSSQLTGSNTS